MFCDVVFDHLVVMRHNGGCSQQVTTEGHGSNLLITHQLLICVKDNKNLKSCHRYYITTSLSSSSSSTRIDDKSLDYIVGQSIHDWGTDISFHRFGGWGLNQNSHCIAFVLRFDNKYLGPFRKIKDVTDSNVAVHCFLC